MAKPKNKDGLDSGNKAMDAWAEHLEQCFQVDEVPAGWATIKDIAATTGLSGDAVRGRVERLVTARKAGKQNFNVETAIGLKPVAHYKLTT